MDRQVISSHRIPVIFGWGSSKSSIVSSASLAIICLFYFYTVGTFFQVRIYPLIDRVTHYIPFNFYIVNEYIDHIVIGALLILWFAFSIKKVKVGYVAIGTFAGLFAAVSVTNNDLMLDAIALSALPAMISVLIYSRYSKQILNNNSHLWLNYLAIIGIVIGIFSFGFAVSTIATNNTAGYPLERNYAYSIFVLFSSISPILLLLLITCFPVKLLADFVASKVRVLYELDAEDITISWKLKGIYLALFMLLSIVIAIIPHLGASNPENTQVGVDSGYYVNWVSALNNSTSTQDFLYQAFVQQRGGDRPVTLIFIYALQQATNIDPFFVIEYMPLILGPALVLAVYLLMRELTSNNVISLLAAFLTAISFHTLIGIYAGFYANWLALIFGYLGFIFLFRFLKGNGKKNLIVYTGLTLLTLFSHVYTWSILAIVAGVFLAVMLKMNYKRNAALLLIALFSTVVVDFSRTSLGASSGFEGDVAIAGGLAGLEKFTLRWNNLTYATTTFVGGIFANFITLGLGIYWLLRAKMKEPISIFIIVFLSIGILPFLFGEWIIQTRVFYNIPFQIPAAIALFHMGKRSGGLLKVSTICLWLIMVSIVVVSNFYLIIPKT